MKNNTMTVGGKSEILNNTGFKLYVCVCVYFLSVTCLCHVLVFCWLMAVVCFLPCFPSLLLSPLFACHSSRSALPSDSAPSTEPAAHGSYLYFLFVSLICGFDLCCSAVCLCSSVYHVARLASCSPQFTLLQCSDSEPGILWQQDLMGGDKQQRVAAVWGC